MKIKVILDALANTIARYKDANRALPCPMCVAATVLDSTVNTKCSFCPWFKPSHYIQSCLYSPFGSAAVNWNHSIVEKRIEFLQAIMTELTKMNPEKELQYFVDNEEIVKIFDIYYKKEEEKNEITI